MLLSACGKKGAFDVVRFTRNIMPGRLRWDVLSTIYTHSWDEPSHSSNDYSEAMLRKYSSVCTDSLLESKYSVSEF